MNLQLHDFKPRNWFPVTKTVHNKVNYVFLPPLFPRNTESKFILQWFKTMLSFYNAKRLQALAQECPQALPALFHGPAATPLSAIGCIIGAALYNTTCIYFHISGERKGEKQDKPSDISSAVPWGWIGCERLMLGQVLMLQDCPAAGTGGSGALQDNTHPCTNSS